WPPASTGGPDGKERQRPARRRQCTLAALRQHHLRPARLVAAVRLQADSRTTRARLQARSKDRHRRARRGPLRPCLALRARRQAATAAGFAGQGAGREEGSKAAQGSQAIEAPKPAQGRRGRERGRTMTNMDTSHVSVDRAEAERLYRKYRE